MIITAVFAFFYQRYGSLPQVQPFLAGIKPAIISVIAALMIDLGKKAVRNTRLAVAGLLSAAAVLLGMNEIAVLFATGLAGMLIHLSRQTKGLHTILPFPLLQIKFSHLAPSSWKLFGLFLKVGAILYGSGYVLFAFLDAELVGRGWLNKQQLTNAIAVGQFTPGPVFSSATFIGWQIGGPAGAFAATAGIFLPSFLFVALLNPWIPKLRQSKIMAAFLDFVNVASVAVILSVLVEIVRSTPVDWRFALIAALGFFVTFRFRKLNTAFTILGGALLGYLLSFWA